ncbi:uncharacterized protein N7459_002906 [Penicillium hispanicum]|uniref:uncharacterized protein n=1 Tax=Penicillium hispanicum TaxID=1080232 RepID=UPI00253FA4E0|nr:uncharacterized protein N7459_002906 [Penicillium hispanicum]KAJ5587141.1 hypothetical protein N7459_002906 [Penicillium hispanicum]
MTPQPTLVFVHGAWHSPECWDRVVPILQQRGYRCLTPQVEFCGTAEPVNSLAGSVNQIQSLIAQETAAGKNVVVVNHSFGGSVGCTSVQGFSRKNSSRLSDDAGHVLGIVQLCAFMPPPNASLYDLIDLDTSFHHADAAGWEIIDNGEPAHVFYNDLSPEDAQLWKSRLLKHSNGTLTDRDNVYAGWADVPVWYLVCSRDQAIPLQVQETMVAAAQNAGASVTTKYLEASHSPFLSKPDETAEFILEAVGSFKNSSL